MVILLGLAAAMVVFAIVVCAANLEEAVHLPDSTTDTGAGPGKESATDPHAALDAESEKRKHRARHR